MNTWTRNFPKMVEKARSCRVYESTSLNLFRVLSPSQSVYDVRVRNDGSAECSCPYGQHRPDEDKRSVCSHTIAVWLNLFRETDVRISFWNSKAEAKKQHKSRLYVGDGTYVTFSKKPKQSKKGELS